MMVNQIRAKNGIPYDSLSYENALGVACNTLLSRREYGRMSESMGATRRVA
jgi:hypothetical protein